MTRIRYVLLLLWLGAWGILPLAAQPYRPIVRTQAYPPGAVEPYGANYSLVQDTAGLMYLAVGKSVFCFDGRTLEPARSYGAHIRSMALDARRNTLWLQTENGVGYLARNAQGQLLYHPLAGTYTLSGNAYIDNRTGQLENNTYQLRILGNQLYFITDEALYRVALPGGKPEQLLAWGQAYEPRGWYELGGQLYILFYGKGVHQVVGRRLVLSTAFQGLSRKAILFAKPLDATRTLLYTHDQLYLCSKQGLSVLSLPQQPEQLVDAVFTDRQLILASANEGCLVYNRLPANRMALAYRLNVATNLPNDQVRKALIDRDNRLWLAHPFSLSWVWMEVPISQIDGAFTQISTILPSPAGRLYLAQDNGLAYLHARKAAEESPEALISLRTAMQVQNDRLRTLSEQQNRRLQRLEQTLSLKSRQLSRLQLEIKKQEGSGSNAGQLLAEMKAEARRLQVEIDQQTQARYELQSQRPLYGSETDEVADAMQDFAAVQRRLQAGALGYVKGTQGISILDLASWQDYLFAATGTHLLLIKGDKVEKKLDIAASRLLPSRLHPDRIYFLQDNWLGVIRYDSKQKKWILPSSVDLRAKNRDVSYPQAIEQGKQIAGYRLNGLIEDEQGNLWIGSSEGLLFLNPQSGLGARNPLQPRSIANNCQVRMLGNTRICLTSQAVYRLVGGRTQRIRALEPYVDLSLPLLVAQGSAWWSLRGRQLYKLEAGTARLLDSTAAPGLVRNTYGLYALKDRLLLATYGGLFALHRFGESHQLQAQYNPVSFTYLRLQQGNETVAYPPANTRQLQLDFSRNVSLEIGLRAPFYSSPDSLVYQYRLSADAGWRLLTEPRIQLDIKPGTYRLEVRARNAFGRWGPSHILSLQMLPPIYERWWFLLALGLLGTLLVWLVSWRVQRVRQRRLQQRAQELELRVVERTEELRQEKEATEALNADLAHKNHEIERQRETIAQQERMAGLGEIAPIMAHEINSPLGAIRAAIDNLQGSMPDTLRRFPVFLGRLSAPLQQQFWQLLQQLMTRPENLSISQERSEVARLATALEAAGVAEARTAAQKLVKGGYTGSEGPVLPFLQGDENARSLPDVLHALGTIFKQLNLVQQSIGRAQNIITRLKNTVYRRADADQPTQVDLKDSWENVLGLYDYHLRQGIQVQLDMDPQLPLLQAYPEELQQVWTNLLMNAVYALKNQGSIRIAARLVGDVVELCFADTGPGIPQDLIDRVFDPMFTTKPKGEGTGLGLTIVKRIIENKHGGSIRVESHPGHTQFILTLPLTPKPQTP
ncbi:MAG: ATP-binding protein [Sphingobacteriia bacterium]